MVLALLLPSLYSSSPAAQEKVQTPVVDRIYPGSPNPFPLEFSMDIVTIFCDIDDFCRSLLAVGHPQLPAYGFPHSQSTSSLSLSEVMTIVVWFHASHYRTFKHF